MSQVKLDQPEDCILDLRDLRTNGRANLYGASCGIIKERVMRYDYII